MAWPAQLTLRYRSVGGKTVGHDRHEGPLRVLQALYPEGPAVCHHVIVHPPAGLVGGDALSITVEAAAGSHALLTTPGATRLYRCPQAPASQRVQLSLAAGARLEWLPMETLAYSGCRTESRVQATLAEGAEMMGWDVLALGLPASNQPFAEGWVQQHLELVAGAGAVCLERARIAAADTRLLHSPLGWAGHTVLATAWWAAGAVPSGARRTALLDAARAVVAGHVLAGQAGVTALQPTVVLLRVLADQVQPAMALLSQVRAAWRAAAWGLGDERPRIWRT